MRYREDPRMIVVKLLNRIKNFQAPKKSQAYSLGTHSFESNGKKWEVDDPPIMGCTEKTRGWK